MTSRKPRPSAGFDLALLDSDPPRVGARCRACGNGTSHPIALPQATPVGILPDVIGYIGDAAALLHTCTSHPPETADA